MLIVFPIGLWVFSLAADIVYLSTGNPAWASVAFFNILGGIIGALIAAVFGFVDWVTLQPSRAKTVGTWHMIINLTVTVLFIINLIIRNRATTNYTGPFVLSIIGIALLLVSGWLGGEMVYIHGIAVEGKMSLEKPSQVKSREKVTSGKM
jgi:uncharacterized membrane protein